MVLGSNKEKFRNRRSAYSGFIHETIKSKTNFKEIKGALGTLDSINAYKYRVGGSNGGSYLKAGFKESELMPIYYPHVFKTGGVKGKNDIISNENMVPILVSAMKDIYKQMDTHIQSINKIQEKAQPLQTDINKFKTCISKIDIKNQCDVGGGF